MILKKDYPYILLAIVIAALVAAAVSNPLGSVSTYALLGIIGIGVVMAIIINPSIGANILIIVIFSNISARFVDEGLPGIVKPLVAIVFPAILIRNYYVGQIPADRPKTKPFEIALIFYALVTFGSFLIAADKAVAQEILVDFIKDIAIMYCLLFCLRKLEDWKNAVTVLIVVISFLSLLGIYQIITGDFTQDFFGLAGVKVDRLGGPVHEPNMWAQVIVAVMPFAMFRFLRSSANEKILNAVFLTLMFINLLNTYSRGGYLAFFIAVIAITFFFTRFNLVFITSILIIAFLTLPLLPQSYRDRFLSLTSFTSGDESQLYEDESFRGRTSEMTAGFIMFTDHPVLGVGIGNYPNYYLEYAQIIGLEYRAQSRDAHSLYLELIAERGILGLIGFVGVVACLFIGLANAKNNLKQTKYYELYEPHISAMQVGFIAYLFAAIFLHDAYIRYFWMLCGLAMSLIQITYEQVKNISTTSSAQEVSA